MSYDWNLVRYRPTIRPSRHWCHEAQDEISKMGLQLHNFDPVLWAVGYHVEQKMIKSKLICYEVLPWLHLMFLSYSIHVSEAIFLVIWCHIKLLYLFYFLILQNIHDSIFLLIYLNIISLLFLSHLTLFVSPSLIWRFWRTANPKPQPPPLPPTATSTAHKPPLPQPKSTKFATKPSK